MNKIKALTFLFAAFILGGCADADHAVHVLDQAGYSAIKTHGYAWWSCSEDDHLNTRFTAKGPTGKPISGAVCCGWAKNCTIRID